MPKEVGSLSSPEKLNNKGLFGPLWAAFEGYMVKPSRVFGTELSSRTGLLKYNRWLARYEFITGMNLYNPNGKWYTLITCHFS